MQSNIFLLETKVPYIKSVKLELSSSQKPKFIGYLNQKEKVFRTKRNDYQIHRNLNAIAFNFELVNRFDIELFQVEYGGKFLFITKEHLFKIGKKRNYSNGGAEPQIFASIKEFSHSVREAKDKGDNQFTMFS